MLPRAFSKLHPTTKTPYVSIIILCSTAFIASLTNSLSALINASVFLLSFAYLATCVSSYFLEKKHSGKSGSSLVNRLVIVFGVAFSVLLMTQVNAQQVLVAMILFAVGVPVYIFFAPKKDITLLKHEYLSRNAILERAYHQGEVYLANVIRHVKLRIDKTKRIKTAWKVEQVE
jgi:amino acid transporter